MIHQGSISAYLSKLPVFKVVFESSVNSLPSTAVLEYCSILVKFVCLPEHLYPEELSDIYLTPLALSPYLFIPLSSAKAPCSFGDWLLS